MAQAAGAPSAAERAYLRIRERILDGDLAPGAMLGEAGLAQELAVSRTPVRAALVRLQQEGWIAIYPQRGALVRGLSQRAVEELAEARAMLEITSARRAAPDARRRSVARLEEVLEAQRRTVRTRDLREHVTSLLAFHRCFVEAGGSDVLLELYERLADRHRFALSVEGEALLERGEETIREHAALAEAFTGGDLDLFEERLRAHVSEVGSPREGV
ncbi:GntR family transcriptional regulator [Brachybacterium kimchii]|uniref:GntR family transcriptional regulator n=1 Tax=Brachybacterium kimchii TaxID=2942909 RepID=A0ABY4N5I0_9MICO|nr:GntR family transcriptional regulator [Brachybacterium kimchii]UQN29111.1 GntR family transcriptional regulator [Brachybacterium kimchii]